MGYVLCFIAWLGLYGARNYIPCILLGVSLILEFCLLENLKFLDKINIFEIIILVHCGNNYNFNA